MNAKDGIKIGKKFSSPEHAECEGFEERNSIFHNVILLLAQAYHMVLSAGLDLKEQILKPEQKKIRINDWVVDDGGFRAQCPN